jgi:hypothetical protein
VTMKNAVFWDLTPRLVRADVSEERIASIIKATIIGELETTLAVTVLRLLVTANIFLARRFLWSC